MESKKLYYWQPDRKTLRWDGNIYDDQGKAIKLENGMELERGTFLNIQKPGKGRLADFLNTPLNLLFVSERTLSLLRKVKAGNFSAFPLIIRDHNGLVIDDTYSWLNIKTSSEIMDSEKSVFLKTITGKIGKVDRFVVNYDAVPDSQLFTINNPQLIIFSETLKEEIMSARLKGAELKPLEQFTF